MKMISQREVTRKYEALLKDVAEKDFYKFDLTNRVNCYTCEKGHVTKTQDIDSGVTPMMFTCRFCGFPARSSFYKDIAPDLVVHGVWYRPTLKQVMKMRNKQHILDHILRGGLEYRENDHSISQDEIMNSYLSKMKEVLSESEFEKESLSNEI